MIQDKTKSMRVRTLISSRRVSTFSLLFVPYTFFRFFTSNFSLDHYLLMVIGYGVRCVRASWYIGDGSPFLSWVWRHGARESTTSWTLRNQAFSDFFSLFNEACMF